MVKNKLLEIRMTEFQMNQKQFAEYLDIVKTTYCGWESGASNPVLEVAVKISKKLNRDVTKIWYLDK